MLHDSRYGLLKVLLAPFGIALAHGIGEEVSKSNLVCVGCWERPIVRLLSQIKIMEENNDQREMAMVVVVESVDIPSHLAGKG